MDGAPSSGPPPSDLAPGRRALVGFLVVVGFAGLVAVFAALSRPPISDEAARASLEAAIAKGPRGGSWEIREAETTRRREFAADPSDPTRVLVGFPEQGPRKVVRFSREYVAVRVFGEWPSPLFFSNYRPERPRPREDVGGARAVRVRYVSETLPGRAPTRTVWLEPRSGEVLRLEDRSFDGGLLHAARWLSRDLAGWEPTAAAARALPGRDRRPRSWNFDDVVASAPFPVYEPTVLPPGFRRVAQVYQEVPIGARMAITQRWGAVEIEDVDVVELRYSDGLAHIGLAMLSAADMKRLEKAMADRGPRTAEPGSCAGGVATSIEELVDSDDELVVRRHANRCATVLKIDDIGGVTVLLRGRNEFPADTYVEILKSLRPAPGSKAALPGSRPVDDWLRRSHSRSPVPPAEGMPDVSAQPEKK